MSGADRAPTAPVGAAELIAYVGQTRSAVLIAELERHAREHQDAFLASLRA